MPLIKDKIYVYVNTTMTGSAYRDHNIGQEFVCIDPDPKKLLFKPLMFEQAYYIDNTPIPTYYYEISETNFFINCMEIQEKDSLKPIIDFYIPQQKYKFYKLYEFSDPWDNKIYYGFNHFKNEFDEYVFEKIEYENEIPNFIFSDLNKKMYSLCLGVIRVLYCNNWITKI
jgi:hypothetical protein